MLNVYLLRHGETPYNVEGNKYCGRSDVALTPKGIKQAEEIAEAIRGVSLDAIYSSPLQRAYRTAEIAGAGRYIVKDQRLTEIDFGQWEGKTRAEFVSENPELWSRWNQDPETTKAGGTGETAGEVLKRSESFFNELQQIHPAGNVLVVAHNGINRLFLARQLGMELKNYRKIVQENSSITLIGYDEEEGFVLKKLNCKT